MPVPTFTEVMEAQAAVLRDYEDAIKAPLIDQIAHLIEKLTDAEAEATGLKNKVHILEQRSLQAQRTEAALATQNARQRQTIRSLQAELDDLDPYLPVSDYDYWRYGY